jgi:hypothetical protein
MVKFREREYIGLIPVSSPDLKAFLVATPTGGLNTNAFIKLADMACSSNAGCRAIGIRDKPTARASPVAEWVC